MNDVIKSSKKIRNDLDIEIIRKKENFVRNLWWNVRFVSPSSYNIISLPINRFVLSISAAVRIDEVLHIVRSFEKRFSLVIFYTRVILFAAGADVPWTALADLNLYEMYRMTWNIFFLNVYNIIFHAIFYCGPCAKSVRVSRYRYGFYSSKICTLSRIISR